MSNLLAGNEAVLEVVTDEAGAVPPHWPANATAEDIRQISGDHVDQMLSFYQLPGDGPVTVRQGRLLMHLGVRS